MNRDPICVKLKAEIDPTTKRVTEYIIYLDENRKEINRAPIIYGKGVIEMPTKSKKKVDENKLTWDKLVELYEQSSARLVEVVHIGEKDVLVRIPKENFPIMNRAREITDFLLDHWDDSWDD